MAEKRRPASTKPPSNGAPTITSSETTNRTTGLQTGSGEISDSVCQLYADMMDANRDRALEELDTERPENAIPWIERAKAAESNGMGQGCSFTH